MNAVTLEDIKRVAAKYFRETTLCARDCATASKARRQRNLNSMAEVQTSTNPGELTQRFIEFVMMQAQNAALFLGQIPNPQTGKGEVNLEVAKMFIDQLAMIQEKTRGNLTQRRIDCAAERAFEFADGVC